jgi:ATP-binding cassette subfamily C (CFTR/MRP) protein 4
MTAVERVLEYTVLPSEPLENGPRKPDTDWPRAGEIIFDKVTYSYDKDLPPVLKDLSFRIGSGEKIGIVGRTGAGKSSIVQTLFRMAEPNGAILVDGLNIKELSLHDLRSKISIIPVSLKIILR